MDNKVYFFIISILINSIVLAMETPDEKSNSPHSQIITEEKKDSPKDFTTKLLGPAKSILKSLDKKLTELEATHKKRTSNLKEVLSKFSQSKEEKPPKSFNNFNYRHILLMLSVSGISFIAGYLMGSKSLPQIRSFFWTKYFKI